MTIPVPYLNPIEHEWSEELKRRIYGGMVSDLLSGVLQTHKAL